MTSTPVVLSNRPPQRAGTVVDDFTPSLIIPGEHELCPGCGEPAAIRSAVEIIDAHRADTEPTP